jgi:hypothetical protein
MNNEVKNFIGGFVLFSISLLGLELFLTWVGWLNTYSEERPVITNVIYLWAKAE